MPSLRELRQRRARRARRLPIVRSASGSRPFGGPSLPRKAAVSGFGDAIGRWRQLVEDCQVELPESLRVGEEVELDDLAVPHRDGADRERLPVAEGDGPGNAVDQRRPYVQPDPGVAGRLARDGRGAAYLPRAADGPEILPQDDIRVEHRYEPIEVALTCGRQKRVDDLTLRFEVRIGIDSLG